MTLTPKKEIFSRVETFRESMKKSGFGAALIYQNVDLFYYTGTLQNGALYVPATGKPLFMVVKNIDRAKGESPIENIVPISNPVNVGDILKQNKYRLPKRIGLEMDVIPAKLYAKLASILPCEIGDISLNVRLQRSIKSEFEISMMKKAAAILKKTFAEIPNMLEEGGTEKEISARIEYLMRRNKHQGVIRIRAFGMELYAVHLSFGASSATPVHFNGPVGVRGMYPAAPQIGGNTKLKTGVPILADIVAGVEGYLVDCTRAYALGGLDDKFIRQHEDCLKLNREIVKRLKPGEMPSEIYADIMVMAKNMGYENNFMASGENQVKFVAHGIGLEVDEIPIIAKSYKMPFAAGNTMAVEPKIISPRVGGVGVENTYLITQKGAKNLTGFNMNLEIVK